jgi:hypothetical protein
MIMRNKILGTAFAAVLIAACGDVKVGGSDAPGIDSFSPERSSALGDTNITLTGFGFEDGSGEATILVGGVLASNVTVVDDATVTFNTPPHEPGTEAEIVLFNSDGTGRAVDTLLYSNHPKIFSVGPVFGSVAGGTTVTITGVGFENFDPGDNTVSIGDTAAESVTVVSDTELSVTTGVSSDTAFVAVDVTVANKNGSAVLPEVFKYTKQGFLLTNCRTPGLSFLDLDTLEVTEIAPMATGLSSLAIHPDGTIYGESCRDNRNLVTLDPLSGEIDIVGALRSGGNTQEIASDMLFVGNTLYGIAQRNARRLITIDIATGAATVIGAVAQSTSQSLCIENIDDASFHIINKLDGDLSTISTVDSTMAVVQPLTGGPTNNVNCHGMLTHDNVTYVMSARPNMSPEVSTIYTLNVATGAMTEFVQLPILAAGLSVTPSDF